ncbi:hypothetical protein ACQQ2N_10110 [Dokdonella sp. MW10]|uniref:hypothetical protein n=1 Tax=Dokdonella sp. MW10 TaxID=2992926 RepID=UPI003F818804
MNLKDLSIDACVALSVSALCVLVAALVQGYADVRLGIPMAYTGDALSAGMIFKSIIENGWYFDNPDAGAPFGLSWGPYPMVETSHFALIWVLGRFSSDYGTVLTMFYLLSFFTVSVTAYCAMRSMGLGRMLSACGALLFSLQPYHFLRASHIFLASYFAVPVFVAFAAALARSSSITLTAPRVAAAIILLLLASGGGVYYAFFGCMLIITAAAISTIERSTLRPLALGIAMTAVVCAGVGISLLPHWNYASSRADDTNISTRLPAESEIYGLKLAQLVLPSPAHRNGGVRNVTTEYSQQSPLVNENATAAIGLLASLGLLVSLIALLIPKLRRPQELADLGRLNLVAFLFATIGGVGTLFAWFVTAQIRGLNRISIVIAFVSLSALLLGVQHLFRNLRTPSRIRTLTACTTVGLGIFGLWDQLPYWRPTFAAVNQPAFERDADMGKRIMEVLPPGSRVYQMPYVKFPEHPPAFQEGAYGLSRWYLHTAGIAWSYGAMKLTESDLWLQNIESMPLDERLTAIKASGFDAVMIERKAYEDHGASMESTLVTLLGAPILECPDASCALYGLSAVNIAGTKVALLALRGSGWSSWVADTTGSKSATSTGKAPMRFLLLNPSRRHTSAKLSYVVNSDTATMLAASAGDAVLEHIILTAGQDQIVHTTIDLPPGITEMLLQPTAPGSSKTSVRIRDLDLQAIPAAQ